MGYGTGAIMAVPAHDERDFEFCRKYGIAVRPVVRPVDGTLAREPGMTEAFTEYGTVENTGEWSGLSSAEARRQMNAHAERHGFGKTAITYRLKDWASRASGTHLLAAGFDIATQAGLRDTLRSAEALLSLANVYVIHANDSKFPLGSHVDRHANIGEGHIGADAFHRIPTHPKLRRKPFILETPVDREGDDRRNLDKLKSLASRLGS
jgi:hypothetical protein